VEKNWPCANIVLSIRVHRTVLWVVANFVPREDCGFELRILSELCPESQHTIRFIYRQSGEFPQCSADEYYDDRSRRPPLT